MANSCRPVSRHDRYYAAGPSSVPFTEEIPSYPMEYQNQEDILQIEHDDHQILTERPVSSRGVRRERPKSKLGRQREVCADTEGYGRPASRRGFRPDQQRYSHDEYSRQENAFTDSCTSYARDSFGSPPSSPSRSPLSPTSSCVYGDQMSTTSPKPPVNPNLSVCAPRPRPQRKSSAKHRRHREQHWQQQQESDDHFSMGEERTPYISQSSLSKYKPLPAIGTKASSKMEQNAESEVSNLTQGLSLDDNQLSSVPDIQETEKVGNKQSRHLYRTPNLNDKYSKNLSAGGDMISSDNNNSSQNLVHGSQLYRNSPMQSDVVYSEESTAMTGHSFSAHLLQLEPDKDEARVLLAVHLPNGQRSQRYFRPQEKLSVILQFAENVSECDLSRYNLVCNMPKKVFRDLSLPIEKSNLQNRTVLYLEEKE